MSTVMFHMVMGILDYWPQNTLTVKDRGCSNVGYLCFLLSHSFWLGNLPQLKRMHKKGVYTHTLFLKWYVLLYIFIVELLSLLCLCGLITNYHVQLSFDVMHKVNIWAVVYNYIICYYLLCNIVGPIYSNYHYIHCVLLVNCHCNCF